MQVTETKSEGLRREFKVVVPAADIERQLSNRLEQLGREVRLPGFRPGKVPVTVLRQRYAASVMGEVLERTVAESSNTAIRERSLQPAGQPKIEVTAFDEGRDLEYTMAIDLLPKFEPMDFSTLKLERFKVVVDDKALDQAIAELAGRHKRYAAAAEPLPAKNGDQLVIDFSGTLNDVAFDGGTAKNFTIVLGESGFVPGFEENLVGRKAGDHVEFALKFPDNYGAKNLAGKTTKFTVDIKEVNEQVPVAVDDQLAKDLGLDDLAALRKAVAEDMEKRYTVVSRMRLKRSLLDALAEAHDFELPPGLVDNELEAIWSQYEAEQAHDHEHHDHDHHDHDHDHHGHDHGPEKMSDEEKAEARAEARQVAERRVRLGLLLGEVGRRNNVTVTPEELTRAIYTEASRYPGQEKQVVEYFKRTPAALASLRAPIFEDKVVDFILEVTKIEERKATAEELMKDPEEPTSSESDEKPKAAKKKTAKND